MKFIGLGLKTLNISGDSLGLTLVTLRINYDIPRAKIFNQALEVKI